MNLLEFKKFCLKRQNWNFIFVEANDKETDITEAKVIPKLEPEVYKTKAEVIDWTIDFADVVIKDDIEIVTVTFKENISTFTKMEALSIVGARGEFEHGHLVWGSVRVKDSINTKKPKTTENIFLGLGIKAKNNIIVNINKNSLIYNLLAHNIIPAESNNLGSGFSATKNEFLTSLVTDIVIKSAGFNDAEEKLKIKVTIPDTYEVKLIGWEDKFKVKISKPPIKVINIFNLLESKYLSKIKLSDSMNHDINIPTNNINLSSINIGRKALLSDYSNTSLYNMGNKEQTLEDKNYIII